MRGRAAPTVLLVLSRRFPTKLFPLGQRIGVLSMRGFANWFVKCQLRRFAWLAPSLLSLLDITTNP
jgi:hypothetical protein